MFIRNFKKLKNKGNEQNMKINNFCIFQFGHENENENVNFTSFSSAAKKDISSSQGYFPKKIIRNTSIR